jgi:hypothetical protein
MAPARAARAERAARGRGRPGDGRDRPAGAAAGSGGRAGRAGPGPRAGQPAPAAAGPAAGAPAQGSRALQRALAARQSSPGPVGPGRRARQPLGGRRLWPWHAPPCWGPCRQSGPLCTCELGLRRARHVPRRMPTRACLSWRRVCNFGGSQALPYRHPGAEAAPQALCKQAPPLRPTWPRPPPAAARPAPRQAWGAGCVGARRHRGGARARGRGARVDAAGGAPGAAAAAAGPLRRRLRARSGAPTRPGRLATLRPDGAVVERCDGHWVLLALLQGACAPARPDVCRHAASSASPRNWWLLRTRRLQLRLFPPGRGLLSGRRAGAWVTPPGSRVRRDAPGVARPRAFSDAAHARGPAGRQRGSWARRRGARTRTGRRRCSGTSAAWSPSSARAARAWAARPARPRPAAPSRAAPATVDMIRRTRRRRRLFGGKRPAHVLMHAPGMGSVLQPLPSPRARPAGAPAAAEAAARPAAQARRSAPACRRPRWTCRCTTCCSTARRCGAWTTAR